MTALSATASGTGAGFALGHGIHYAIVAAGIVGILALLLPQLHERLAGAHRPRARVPRDVHEAEVMMLRAEIASGALGTRRLPTLQAPPVEPWLPVAARTLLPAAFVASTAAAGVHAAMAPSHLAHGTASGLFFLAAAVFQLGWAAGLVLGISRWAAMFGAVANLAFVGLWGVTRTVGLPGLMAQPEAIGPWDLSCVAWELVVVVACLRLLASGGAPGRLGRVCLVGAVASVVSNRSGKAAERRRARSPIERRQRGQIGSETSRSRRGLSRHALALAPWHRWDGRVAAFAVGSAAVLAALSFSGFSG